MIVGDIKYAAELLENGQITYQQFQSYISSRPDSDRKELPEWFLERIK